MRIRRSAAAALLSGWLAVDATWGAQAGAAGAPREISILHLRVVAGEAAVFPAGSKSNQPITVQITDETGGPVERATVSFLLPDSGPTGVFASGLKSEVVTTTAEGRASLYGVTWSSVPGSCQIRVTAAKGRARAGMVISVYVAESAANPGSAAESRGRVTKPRAGSRGRWAVLTLVIAGAAAGGLAAGLQSSSKKQTQTQPVQIGSPSITIGRP